MDWQRATRQMGNVVRPAACVAACVAAAVGVPVILTAVERAGTPAVLRVEVLPEPCEYLVDGRPCRSASELRLRLRARAADAAYDDDDCSLLRVEIAAPGYLHHDELRRVTRVCAAERVARVTWCVNGSRVAADIRRDRGSFRWDPRPADVRVRVGRSPSGEPLVGVNGQDCPDLREAVGAAMLLTSCSIERTIEVAPLPGARVEDVFAAMRAIRHVYHREVGFSGIAVPVPPVPGERRARGIADARDSARKGCVWVRGPVAYGLAGDHAERLLEVRYGITVDHPGCTEDHSREYREGYNSVSRALLARKFGRDVVAECEADARAYVTGAKPELAQEIRAALRRGGSFWLSP